MYKNILEKIKNQSIENKVPIVRDKTADLLSALVSVKSVKSILEIGTATGYSGCVMLSCNKKAKLTTLEIDDERIAEAKKNFDNLNLQKRVRSLKQDAKIFLQNNKKKFNFVFLDGPKGQYINYLNDILRCLSKNGILFADNVLLHGMVNSNMEKKPTMVKNLEKFNKEILENKHLTSVILEIDDGIAICVKKD